MTEPEAVPTVYAWTTGPFGGEDEAWCAMADDGEVLAQHISSNRSWGQNDVHLVFSRVRRRYEEKFGGIGDEFYRFVVLPEGEQPPPEVWEANRRWAATQEATQ